MQTSEPGKAVTEHDRAGEGSPVRLDPVLLSLERLDHRLDLAPLLRSQRPRRQPRHEPEQRRDRVLRAPLPVKLEKALDPSAEVPARFRGEARYFPCSSSLRSPYSLPILLAIG